MRSILTVILSATLTYLGCYVVAWIIKGFFLFVPVVVIALLMTITLLSVAYIMGEAVKS